MYLFLEKFLQLTGFFEKALAGHIPGHPPGVGGVILVNPISACQSDPTFLCVVNNIIDGLFTLAIPITSVMVLVGGFQILFAAGNPEKLTTGKKTIIYAVIGFAVIILAKGVALIIQDFFG